MSRSDSSVKKRLRPSKSGLAAVAVVALLLGATSVFNAASSPTSAAAANQNGSEMKADAVTSLPVSFEVENVNRSKVACASDGATYTVRGHIVGPTKELRRERVKGATLYLHGLSFGEFFWDFAQAQNYDFATNQAKAGQVSVVIDRLGYVSSDKPEGNSVCVGSQADIAHQIVLDLRAGSYNVTPSGQAPEFSRVVLAGHSYGGQIAQVAAYSFGDIDGLIVIGYADRVQSQVLKDNAAYAAKVCASGGLRVGGAGPAGYAPFGAPEGAAAALFNSADPAVQSAALQLLTIDPCGDTASFAPAVAVDLVNVPSIEVPVLIIAGGSDALFPVPAGPDQASLFTGAASVDQVTLPNFAHAVTLEHAYEPSALRPLNDWLQKRFHK
ncbi:alpha/beta fold hydrolase [Cryobacterium sp. Hz9]|uniref:alpha/beta fold hydrolase n=1 Tax=Cryobacterium sp. Hz9 TaxID=1259167 RepID=UPI00106A6BE3|nr:alpha/beta hydrolase [Cryobacterium sp. Hz9]TFB67377.1 alpha/beta hydrolase [Cryobacterium sp. Hz9]